MIKLEYKFIALSRYHSFLDVCYKNKITAWVTKDHNNLNKQFKKWYDHIFINEEQRELFKDYEHCVINELPYTGTYKEKNINL